jgi:hypothetical protein
MKHVKAGSLRDKIDDIMKSKEVLVEKNGGSNEEREEITPQRHKILTWKTLFNKEKVNTTDVSYQNFTISRMFTNALGYLIMPLAGGLQGVYIVGGNDTYL